MNDDKDVPTLKVQFQVEHQKRGVLAAVARPQ